MDREKLARVQEKLSKYGNILRYFSLAILTFLFFQIQVFSIDTSTSLLPKITLLAGILQIVLFSIFIKLEEGCISNQLRKYIVEDKCTTLKMALPPALLALSTMLIKIASDILPEETKKAKAFYIIGVALCSFLILGKRFLLTQIIAVILIAFGLSQLDDNSNSLFATASLFAEKAIYGYVSILAAIVLYGLSFSILESVLKKSDEDVSLWVRGIQINIFSVPISIFVIIIFNHYIDHRGFFDNFNIITWFFIIFICSCNITELFVLKVADGMFRMISLTLATMLIGIMQNAFSFEAHSSLKIGCGLIVAGIFLYSILDALNGTYETRCEQYCAAIPLKQNCYEIVPTVSYKVKN